MSLQNIKHTSVSFDSWNVRTMEQDRKINKFIRFIEKKEEIKFKLKHNEIYYSQFHIKDLGEIFIELSEDKKFEYLYIDAEPLTRFLSKKEIEIINKTLKEIMNNSKMKIRYLLNQKAY